jgi:hypothetical protein
MNFPLSLHWDYGDQLEGLGRPYGYEQMLNLCKSAKEVGVDSLNFRVEGYGMMWVPNPVRPVTTTYDPTAAVKDFDYGRHPVSQRPGFRIGTPKLYQDNYKVCPDPLKEAVAAAREVGIKLNVYICPYDQYYPGVPDTLVAAHVDRCITSRDGKERISVLSMAFEENRAELLRMYDAVLKYDIADVIVYQTTHSWYSFPPKAQSDWFGYEEPAVEDYKAKTGIDVRNDAFDPSDYYKHYGTYWTTFLKALSDRQAKRGHRLIVGMDMGPWQIYFPAPTDRPMTTWRHWNDWRTWTQWKNTDICVGHQTNMYCGGHGHEMILYQDWPTYMLPYMPGGPDRQPYTYAREMFGERKSRDFNVHAFLTFHPHRVDAEFSQVMHAIKTQPFDGLMIREAADFEFKLGWERLRSLRK